MSALPETAAAPLTVLIVDDEPLARDDLRLLLRMQPGVRVIGSVANGADAMAAMREELPDVLLLDVKMPGVDGLKVVSRLDRNRMPYVVFVTAFDQYAVEAFRLDALDYVLKPVRAARLSAALERARRQLRLRSLALSGAGEGAASWTEVMVRVGMRDVLVRLADVLWIEAETYYARLHVRERSYLLRERMHVLEANLDSWRFARVHRSAIVNMEYVAEVKHDGGEHMVVLSNGRQIRTSRHGWVRFRALMQQRASPAG